VSKPVAFSATEGLRLRTTQRGPRIAIGPRISRIHVGAGHAEGTGDHAAWRRWSMLAVGGLAPEIHPERRPSNDSWVDQRTHLDTLLTAHERQVTRACPPTTPAGDGSHDQTRRELLDRATAGIPWWNLPARLAARRAVRHYLDVEVARRRAAGQSGGQAQADGWWAALQDNDEPVLLEHLDRCYRASGVPATPTGVEDESVSVVVAVDTPERLIGRREPSMDDEGEVSFALMGKARRHELYVQAMGSWVLAVVAETFAAAPGIRSVAVAVIAPAHPAGPAVIALGEFDREVVLPEDADRAEVTDLELAAAEGRVRWVMERSGQARAPRPLPREYPPVDLLLDILEVEA
jgi:hypothetical protein